MLALSCAGVHADADGDGIEDDVEGMFNGGVPLPIDNNGSFEVPVLTVDSLNVPESEVPLWSTTDQCNCIEVWASGVNGVSAQDGNQFVELNATQNAPLSQTLTVPSEAFTLQYSFAHRGRDSINSMSVSIGADEASKELHTTVSSGTGSWQTYSRLWEKPEGVTSIYIEFNSMDAISGASGVSGNLIDGITMLGVSRDTDKDSTPDYMDLDSDNDGVPDSTEGSDNSIEVASPVVTGIEDSPVALGLSINSTLLAGGSQLDIVDTEAGFRDAAAGITPTVFTVPDKAGYARITGMGGKDNGSTTYNNEEFVSTVILVDLNAGIYSGHTANINTQVNSNDNYVFSAVPLGNASDSGGVVGDNNDSANSITVSLSGSSLFVTETQNISDQAYLVEYLTSSESSSNYLESLGTVMEAGAVSDTFTLAAETGFMTISIMMGETEPLDSTNEDKGLGYITVDADTRLASGVMYTHLGSGDANVSSYAFTDYDLASGVPVLSSNATIVGDISADPTALSNPTISLVANVLTITRTTEMASKHTALYSLNNYQRVDAGSAAKSLGSSSATGDYIPAQTTNTFDLLVPTSAESGAISFIMYNVDDVGNASNQETNENAGLATISVNLLDQTTSGSFVVVRADNPDLVSWTNVPFDVRLFDHPNTISNHTAVTDFSDELPAVLMFSMITQADGSQALRASAEAETRPSEAYFKYEVIMNAQWSGTIPMEIAISPVNGTLSHGSYNSDTGLWMVDAAEIADVAFIPNAHFSGNDTNIDINFNGENDSIAVELTRVADAPLINTFDRNGIQQVPVDISGAFSVTAVDQDGSEILTTELIISTDHTVTDGINSFRATAGSNVVDISTWNSNTLSYLSSDIGTFSVQVRVRSTDDDGFSTTTSTIESNDSFDVTLSINYTLDVEVLVDTDADGISDTDEGVVDSDGDGELDYLDPDNDQNVEVIPDGQLETSDLDGDGIPDNLDSDIDGDGIANIIEGILDPATDTDGDGIPNYADTDSDNDGIADSVENIGDADGDGVLNAYDFDSDDDGISDSLEGSGDTDGDGTANFVDPDSDGDGLPDRLEGFVDGDNDGIPNYIDLDADNDGILDVIEEAGDSDNDGIPDAQDLDSDNDGLADLIEAGAADINGNGRVDGYQDTNDDGVDDGIFTLPLLVPDTDNDGVPDNLDLDSDNDGIPDTQETGFAALDQNADGMFDSFIDLDGDGWATWVPMLDTDSDGIADHLDLDSNGDGTSDLIEYGGTDVNGDGLADGWQDIDADGIADNVDADQIAYAEDADGDGIADFADVDFLSEEDSDLDGIVDRYDIDPYSDGFARVPSPSPSPSPSPVAGAGLPDTDSGNAGDGVDGDSATDTMQPLAAQGYVRTGAGTAGSAELLTLLMMFLLGLILLARKVE